MLRPSCTRHILEWPAYSSALVFAFASFWHCLIHVDKALQSSAMFRPEAEPD